MGTTARTSLVVGQEYGENYAVAKWDNIPNGNDGQVVEMPAYADRSVQVGGTFGTGGTVVLEGSNDGATYATLKDPFGNDISFTAAGLKQVVEICKYMRPRVTAGDGTTAIDVTLLMRK